MAAMTKEELKQFISEVTLPLVREHAGKQVGEVVEASIAKALEPIQRQQTDWAAKLFKGDGNGAAKPKERDKGAAFGRIVRAVAVSRLENLGPEGPGQMLAKWGDEDLAKDVKEYREKALAASSATAGGFLVPEQYSTDIIALRRAAVVVRSMGPREIPMPTGTLNIPKITAGASASYVGENTNIPKTQPTFGQVKLTYKKLVALVPFSNDLLRYSSPSADAVVRDDIVRAMAVAEDGNFLRGDGTTAGPKGLRYWAPAANLIGAAAVSLANVTTDLGKLIVQLMNNNVPMTRPGWLMSPRSWNYLMTVQTTTGAFAFRDEMNTGRLWGWPFKMTTAVPITLTVGANSDCSEVYLTDFDDAVIGDSQRLVVDVSMEAAYYDGSSVVAAFSQDQSVVRTIAEHDFAMRDSNAVAILTGVRWF